MGEHVLRLLRDMLPQQNGRCLVRTLSKVVTSPQRPGEEACDHGLRRPRDRQSVSIRSTCQALLRSVSVTCQLSLPTSEGVVEKKYSVEAGTMSLGQEKRRGVGWWRGT